MFNLDFGEWIVLVLLFWGFVIFKGISMAAKNKEGTKALIDWWFKRK